MRKLFFCLLLVFFLTININGLAQPGPANRNPHGIPVSGINVFDADGEYLGIYAGGYPFDSTILNIFVPSQNAFIEIIRNQFEPGRGLPTKGVFLYDVDDMPYYQREGIIYLMNCDGTNRDYVGRGDIVITPVYKMLVGRDCYSQVCSPPCSAQELFQVEKS